MRDVFMFLLRNDLFFTVATISLNRIVSEIKLGMWYYITFWLHYINIILTACKEVYNNNYVWGLCEEDWSVVVDNGTYI